MCVEAHDLAASKLAAYREKDKEFVRLLLIERMIDAKILTERIRSLNVKELLRVRLLQWVKITAEELGRSGINSFRGLSGRPLDVPLSILKEPSGTSPSDRR